MKCPKLEDRYVHFFENFMENSNQKCSRCGCKVSVVVSVLALAVAGASYFCPKHSESAVDSSTFDERIKNIMIDAVKQNPQLLMDAMGEGMAKQREEALKQVEIAVGEKTAEISKLASKLGELESKTSVICFIDPLEKSCVELQRSMIKLIKAKKDVCFKILPVAVLGDDSVTLAKVYLAAYEKGIEQAVKFIDSITSTKGEIDKKAIDNALKSAGLNSKEIEGMLDESDKKLIENGKMADSLKIPVVPAIFLTNGDKTTMLKLTSAEQLESAIDENTKK